MSNRTRLESVDVVRGVIMIVMALDHTREFFGFTGQSPTNLATTTIPLFLTRWITHFCAPVFFLLTGTGAFLSLQRKSPAELSRFLWTRGLWLIFLETIVVRSLAYQFNVDFRMTLLLVLWALGWSMIALAALVRFPAWIAATIGIAMIAGHNLLDSVPSTSPIWLILHRPGFVLDTPDHTVFTAYPLIPWIGVTAGGYALGQVYRWDGDRRRAFMLRLGVALTLTFVVLRAVNIYGDPSRWRTMAKTGFTALSFLNVTKQPPSLLFLLMTIGPALVLLWSVDRSMPRLLRPALLFGKVPLFYFFWHFVVIHALAVVVCYARYGSAHWMFASPDLAHYPFTAPPGWGYNLPIVYALWIGIVIAMYPLCRWFATLRERRSDKWLSYL